MVLITYEFAPGCGSSGWQAPELLLHGQQTRAVDLFSLGCVLFYCMTGGRHPFGSRLERDINIVKSKVDLSLLDHIPEAVDLLLQLLNPNAKMRYRFLNASLLMVTSGSIDTISDIQHFKIYCRSGNCIFSSYC